MSRTPSYEFELLHQFEEVFRDGEHRTQAATRDYSRVWKNVINAPPEEGVTPVLVYRQNGEVCAAVAGMDDLVENDVCAMEIARLAAEIARLKAEVEGLREAVSVLAWTCCEDCGGTGEWWANAGEDDPVQAQCARCCAEGIVPPSNNGRRIEQLMREGVVVRALAAKHERQALAARGQG